MKKINNLYANIWLESSKFGNYLFCIDLNIKMRFIKIILRVFQYLSKQSSALKKVTPSILKLIEALDRKYSATITNQLFFYWGFYYDWLQYVIIFVQFKWAPLNYVTGVFDVSALGLRRFVCLSLILYLYYKCYSPKYAY